jgi:hypothetical protein
MCVPEAVEHYRWKTIRKDDDIMAFAPDVEPVNVLRASIGGTEEIGFYLTFRGDPERIAPMLKMAAELARALVDGKVSYKDERERAH